MTPEIFTQVLLTITLAVMGLLVARMMKIAKQIDDLHTWHNVSGEDGVKVWYVRKSLEEAIVKLAENISRQTDLMAKWQGESHDIMRDLQRERKKRD